nr:immunoglobulin heavy chain junction region [Mus musculus]
FTGGTSSYFDYW